MRENWERQIEREEDELTRQANDGEITQSEYNKAMRDLQRAVRETIEEEAHDAYESVMDQYRL